MAWCWHAQLHHSVNYRSVVIFGEAELVIDKNELYHALEMFTEKMCKGRWADVRKPTDGEWKSTMLLSIEIKEASAKVRTGGPKDDEEDYAMDVWAGVVPLKIKHLEPIADELLKPKNSHTGLSTINIF
ncbi:MAG: pyridoxamine 5'-phosphate oxidase family protein [Cyclobacteriaceae bacterium]